MTKSFSALLAALVSMGLAPGAAAQTFPTDHAPPWSMSGGSAFVSLGRPGTPYVPSFPVTSEPIQTQIGIGPFWIFDPRHPVSSVDPDLIGRAIDIATREGVLGVEVAAYQIAHPGPGYVGFLPRAVPEGWIVTNRCLAWDSTYATDERPLGDCYAQETRPLLGNPHSVAWD